MQAEIAISTKLFIRINKYICNSGFCSRRAADALVRQGVVLINGQQAMLGDKVSSDDTVTVDGLPLSPLSRDETLCIALNKPVGIVCTAASSVKGNIVDFVAYGSRVFPIGRLDKDSQGLILLTNRGALADKILGSDHRHEKEYRVTVDKPVNDEFMAGISNGVPMLGEVTKKCRVIQESECVFRITLVQGLNRQIRRMCKHYHYAVIKLERIRIMHVELAELPLGQWRNLEKEELSRLLHLLDR